MMKHSSLVILFFLFSALNLVIFSMAVPIWHGPDEQAHFGQVANNGEFNRTLYGLKTLNGEIYDSEVLLGTLRDEKGNNKFTFHPEFRIEYTSTSTGLYESSLSAIPISRRQTLVSNESTVYPPLFYIVSSYFYKFGYSFDLLNRVYLTRVFGIMLGVFNLYIVYLFSKELFPSSKLKQITLCMMVAFQPMLNFVFATVNSDNLFNVYFTLCLFLGFLIIKKGLNLSYVLSLVLLLLIGPSIKPQFVLILPIWMLALLINLFCFWKKRQNRNLTLSLLGIMFFLPIGVIIVQSLFNIVLISTLKFLNTGGEKVVTFPTFLRTSLYRTYHETIPWYWGVFDWLGVTLPRVVNRTLNYLLVISVIGGFVYVVKQLKLRSLQNLAMYSYLVLATLIYYFGIVTFDFLYTNSSGGISIGMQGRYFFPVLLAHMSLILIGVESLVPGKWKNRRILLLKVLGLGFLFLNFIGLYTILNSYYSFASLELFFNQLSQYKPIYLKTPFNLVYMFVHLFLFAWFAYTYLATRWSKDEANN